MQEFNKISKWLWAVICGFVLWGCHDELNLPQITIVRVDSVSYTRALVELQMEDEGTTPLIEKGICWAQHRLPEVSDSFRISQDSSAVFRLPVGTLKPATRYYIRAFARNQQGLAYSESDSLFTLSPAVPAVRTLSVEQSSSTTLSCSGSVDHDGGNDIRAYGFCWNTTGHPTVEYFTIEGTGESSNFTAQLTGLVPSRTYYVCSFATNELGTGYGEVFSVETPAPKLPGVVTDSVFNITTTAALGHGHLATEGDSPVLECGFCWSESNQPNINSQKKAAPLLNGKFWSAMTDLFSGTTYYARSYVQTADGVSYGDIVSFITVETRVTYTLHKSSSPTATEKEMYQLIETAMNEACSYYSKYTSLSKHLNVYYNSGVPTADANYNGTIRFGQKAYMQKITAMHEIAHTFGVGTSTNWSKLIVSGVYVGAKANAVYQSITGNSSDRIKGDGMHFWPYGLNYTSEVKSNDDLINHCKIVDAMIRDGL